MRRTSTSPFIWGLAAAGTLLAASVQAQVLVDWGPNCFGWETAYSGHISSPGSELTILGRIDDFSGPLGGLDPDAMEYTFIFEDLISQGTVVIGGIIFETAYVGGVFRIYEDSTPDFEFGIDPPNGTAPATFTDGELILEGTLSDFEVVLIDDGQPPGATGNFTARWVFTGGSLYPLVPGCYGPMLGDWTDDPRVAPIPQGYTCHTDGKFDLENCPGTPVEDGSWGAIKSLYR